MSRQPDEATRIFEAQRVRLERLAYRMLGSLAEAEDVVQTAWLRWRDVDRSTVRAPESYLSRIVTRLCLDAMKSARARRETYFGSWLPDPVVDTRQDEETDGDELTLALMLALERLSPLERAAFLLHDVFAVPLDEVATTLDRDAGAVRQLAVRARRHVQSTRPRYRVAPEEGARVAQAFFTASRSGDTNALRTLLAQNVVIHSDGGGKVLAFPNPIVGIERVLRLYAGLRRKLGLKESPLFEPVRIDGLPGYVSFERDGVFQTTAFAIEDGRIAAIFITRNPDKLSRVVRALDAQASLSLH